MRSSLEEDHNVIVWPEGLHCDPRLQRIALRSTSTEDYIVILLRRRLQCDSLQQKITMEVFS